MSVVPTVPTHVSESPKEDTRKFSVHVHVKVHLLLSMQWLYGWVPCSMLWVASQRSASEINHSRCTALHRSGPERANRKINRQGINNELTVNASPPNLMPVFTTMWQRVKIVNPLWWHVRTTGLLELRGNEAQRTGLLRGVGEHIGSEELRNKIHLSPKGCLFVGCLFVGML